MPANKLDKVVQAEKTQRRNKVSAVLHYNHPLNKWKLTVYITDTSLKSHGDFSFDLICLDTWIFQIKYF